MVDRAVIRRLTVDPFMPAGAVAAGPVSGNFP